jgi:dUTP pyrophosphatase
MKTKTILLRNAKEIYNGKFYQTSGAAGLDLKYIGKEPIVIPSGENKLVPTGLQMEIPDGFYLAIHPRSGLAAKHNITLGNAVGVVDSDYRGEIQAIIYNAGKDDFIINEGDRIAQAVLMKHEKVKFDFVNELNETERGEGGFGSTGAK